MNESNGTPERFYKLRDRAEDGDAEAQYNLGARYATGEGVPQQDAAEAVRWYQLAAEQGYAAAQYALGLMYTNGEGVSQDDAEAVRLYRLAAEQGHIEAQLSLGAMYAKGLGVLPQDDVTADMWLNLAASRSTGELREDAVKARDAVAERLTPEGRSEAQRRAREWDAAHPR